MHLRLLLLIILPLFWSSCSWFEMSNSAPKELFLQRQFSLFDGKNLDQWVIMGNPEGFKVVNGVIRSEAGKGGNWLRTKNPYDNFILTLEWRVSPGGNSGVFLRCEESGNPWETGYECQISNEQPPRDELHCTGSLYGYVAAKPRPSETPEVWHKYEILCKNKRIMVSVDGIRTLSVDQEEVEAIKNKPMKGFIGLQDAHSGEGTWVEFRNIVLRQM